MCYLWSDVEAGLEGFVVVFGQELVKQQVELVPELARVCPQSPEPRSAAAELFLGVGQRSPPPALRPLRDEGSGLRGQSHRGGTATRRDRG